jgi:hypothetical protein
MIFLCILINKLSLIFELIFSFFCLIFIQNCGKNYGENYPLILITETVEN